VELLLNAVIINLVAFSQFVEPEGGITGKVFAIIVYVIAAAEAAVGFAIVISIWRTQNTVAVEELDLLKG